MLEMFCRRMILDAVVADAIASIILRPLNCATPTSESRSRVSLSWLYLDGFDRIGWKCVAYLSIRIESLTLDQISCPRDVFKAMLGLCICWILIRMLTFLETTFDFKF